MRKEEFESRIRELLPDVSEKAMDHTASYAEELEREAEECAESLYDAFYVELALVKRDHGAEIAKAIFDCGEHFTFNFFELRGAAHRLCGLYDPRRDGTDGGGKPPHGLNAVARPRGNDERGGGAWYHARDP